MQKVTAFLEQHVQWVAIGLGALFCLFMTWSYVITPPAEVTIGNDTLGPSEVDPHTADTVAAKLSTAMTSSARIKIDVPQYVQGFNDTMTWKGAKEFKLAGISDPSLSLPVTAPTAPPPLGLDGKPIQTVGGTPPPGGPVPPAPTGAVDKLTALPVPPKPKYDAENGLKYGRSVVIPLSAPGQPAPTITPGVIPPGAIDTDWVTQMWTVSMPQLDAAWQKARLNNPALQGLNTTVFLNVEMVREEQVDGKWQNETVIAPLDVTRANQPRMPYPPTGVANKGQQFAYIIWAAQNTADIIQPLFHNTVPGKGDQWTKPGAQVLAAVQFNPADWAAKPDLSSLTKEQKDAVMQYRRDQQKLLQEQKKQNRGTPRAPGGGRGGPTDMMDGGGNYAPARDRRSYAPIRAEQLPHFAPAPGRGPGGAPVHPPVGRNPYGPPGDMMDGGGEGGFGGYGGAPQAPGLPVAGTDFPTGEFNPSDPINPPPQWKTKDVEVWAHDPTVQAGKVYRYKMRYMLKNPIFGAGNVANPPTLSDEFAIASEWSDWTTQITVPSLVNFFVAGGGVGTKKTVAFEIFRWDQGQQKSERFDLAPGDPVGWAKNGIDFGTDWTVVDFREDPRTNDPQILLLNNTDGRVMARSFGADRNDKLYNALKKQVTDAKAAETAALGGPAASAAGGAAAVGR